MNAGDIVQIRQFDAVEFWIYAKVIDPNTRQVIVQHPGNAEDGKLKIVAASEIRTKADVQALATAAQALASGKLTSAQLTTLATQDGFFKSYLKPDQTQNRDTLHTRIVKHFQSQVDALS